MERRPTAVLVHGAFHGSWCWDKVLPLLADGPLDVRTVDLPLTSLADDVAALMATLDEIEGPVLLGAHSYGGMVASGAGTHPGVRRLLYLTAVVPEPGQTMSKASAADESHLHAPDPDFVDGALVHPAHLARSTFYGDCSDEDVAFATARIRPTGLECFTGPVDSSVAWQERASTYVVCTADGAIDPAVQRRMAHGIADHREWDTAHSP